MITDIPIEQIENNTGQLNGLPANPRITNQTKLSKLIDSIKHDPEMLELRGLLVYPIANGKYITIGGNMRLQALKMLNYNHVPCIVIPKETSIQKLKNYIIKDNGDFGDWDFTALQESWDISELDSWAIDVEPMILAENKEEEERKRNGWNTSNNSQEGVCDMAEHIQLHKHGNFYFVASYKKSESGFPLSIIKSNDNNIRVFADSAIQVIRLLIGINNKYDWCIITTPKRRHKEHNFASLVCERIAMMLGIPYHDNVASAKTRQRVNAEFNLDNPFNERNVIIYDDILTTGSTLTAMNNLFPDKNIIFIVGINNN